jgi:hypothetical protein
MKKFLLIATLLFVSIESQSQVLITLLLGDALNSDGLEFGLEGGVNWSTISDLETTNYARKWNLGFYFDIRIKNQWSFYTGVLVKSNLGVGKLTDNDLEFLEASIYKDFNDPTQPAEGDYSQKMNYFLVPALAKYTFKNNISAEAGPQFGLMYKAWIEFESDVESQEAIIKEDNKDKINRIDAGLMAGLGYKFKRGPGWTIGAKYYYGLVNVYKDRPGTRNSSLFLKLNIPIGAGDKSEKSKKE